MICKCCFKKIIRRHLLDYLSDTTMCHACEHIETSSHTREKIPFFNTLLEISMFPLSHPDIADAYTLYHQVEVPYLKLDFNWDDAVLVLVISLHLDLTFYTHSFLTLNDVERLTKLERFSPGLMT